MKITVYVNENIVSRAKAQSFKDNISLSEVVEKALDQYLKKAILIATPAENAPEDLKNKLKKAETFISEYNAGTAPLDYNQKPTPTISEPETPKVNDESK